MNKGILSFTLATFVSVGVVAQGSAVYAEETKVQLNDTYDTPSYIIENWEAPDGLTKEEIVQAYIKQNSEEFKLESDTNVNFEIIDEQEDQETGTSHFVIVQNYNGIPIYGADQTIALDENNDVTSYFGQVISDLDNENIATQSSVSKEKAVDIFKTELEKKIGTVDQYDGEINVEPYIYEYDDAFYLTYLVTGSTTNPEVGYWHYFIDARNGDIIDSYNAAHTATDTTVDNGTSSVTAFGTGVFGERQKFVAEAFDDMFRLFDETRGDGVVTYDNTTGTNVDFISRNKMFTDGSAVDAHANAQTTYDYFLDTFGRDSVDDNGQILISAVHVGDNWNNASWNGRQMSYGDGDGERFHPLAGGLDVAAHEMAHGVIQHTAGLIYRDESGALNESFADIFGAMVDREDWIIGDDIMADGTIGLRSMEDPTALIERRTQAPYPDHWSKLYTGDLDNGGVHINSSINNKAAYLMAEGGEHYGVEVNGVGRDATEQIYYRALSLYLTSSADFSMMRQAAIEAASDLYGSNSDAVAAVEGAYDAVGVY
ncbi:peptidase M4 family protein [Virgibacillus sp. NKC19-16]|uniref:M4 family metallopeptidase n=1 Tax=Virgibacillus salidurans TaxID=2831673 RepID=UPI001F2AD72B|nr:M4 family metallopeptidase [Virgibacillus sp. NKC19-16]UJL48359.1 peptidase M4 family protein [Virgibacillus sp. NKC19-16]